MCRNARTKALSSAQAASPLAKRPYDLRHACASLWLNSGVDATDVAERLGHSLDMLLKVYANCVDGSTDRNNARIAAGLASLDIVPQETAQQTGQTVPQSTETAGGETDQPQAA